MVIEAPDILNSIFSEALPKQSKVCEWLLDCIADQLDPEQYGNIRKSSTSLALLRILHDWHVATDKSPGAVRAVFLDFSKAFDRIDHCILLNKLQTMGVPGTLLAWIRAFLTDRQHRVKLNGAVTSWVNVNGGVPQGTKLGPLLFLVMVNDLTSNLPMIKYVDDTTVYQTTTDIVNCDMQSAMNDIISWCDTNHMKLNEKKTVSMDVIFTNNRPSVHHVKINNSPIETVHSFKLLGLLITDDLSWEANTAHICQKANSRLYGLTLLRRAGLSQQQLLRVFKSIIRPVVEYACTVWHFSLTKADSDKIESIQKRALTTIFGKHPYESNLESAGLPSLEKRRGELCQKLFSAMQQPGHKLHHLLPQVRSSAHHLRRMRNRESIRCHTKRSSNSFIMYCLTNLQ